MGALAPKPAMPTKYAVRADDGVPALTDRRLDADLDLGVADHGAALIVRQREQQFETTAPRRPAW